VTKEGIEEIKELIENLEASKKIITLLLPRVG
jgi:hypothetical protein